MLTPAARQSLQQSVAALRENYEAIIDGQEQFFVEEAKRSKIDPARVTRGVKPPASDVPAIQVPDSQEGIAEEMTRLQQENEALEKRLAELRNAPAN